MESFIETLEKRDLHFSLVYYGEQDLATRIEINNIIGNFDLFGELYSRFPLTKINTMDQFYLYMFSQKIVLIREMVPFIINDEHKQTLTVLIDNAEKTLKEVPTGDVIKFINQNIEMIFSDQYMSVDLDDAALSLILKYANGIDEETFTFLFEKKGHMIIDRFNEFEAYLEKNSHLVALLFPADMENEIYSLRRSSILKIWSHLLNKKNSSIKDAIASLVPLSYTKMKDTAEQMTVENIMLIEHLIREYDSFLKSVQSPLVYEFSEYVRLSENLLNRYLQEKGQTFEYTIPIGTILKNWEEQKNWEKRLLMITHDFSLIDNRVQCKSRLSKPPEQKNHLVDLVGTNIPTDEFYTLIYQRLLSITLNIGIGMIIEILRKEKLYRELMNSIVSAAYHISNRIDNHDEKLYEDVQLLQNMLNLVVGNLDAEDSIIQPLCYGTIMFMCALAEKVLRMLYVFRIKNQTYVPLNKATLGELLSENNEQMKEVFGEVHLKNLSYFFLQVPPKRIGENIRNSVAHWANLSSKMMTPFLVAKVLWLFLDIINTVFWLVIEDSFDDASEQA